MNVCKGNSTDPFWLHFRLFFTLSDLEVSVLVINSADLSSNPAEVYSFSEKMLFHTNEIK